MTQFLFRTAINPALDAAALMGVALSERPSGLVKQAVPRRGLGPAGPAQIRSPERAREGGKAPFERIPSLDEVPYRVQMEPNLTPVFSAR